MSNSAAIAKELDDLYRDERQAEGRYNAASEAASEDTVDSCREDWSRIRDKLRARVPAVGRELYDEGGTAALQAVLGLVDPKNRGRVSIEWKGIADLTH